MSRGAVCRSCRAPIVWARVEGSGKKIPVDVRRVENGNLTYTGKTHADGSLMVRYLRADEDFRPTITTGRYVSHFATCPNADQHRRK